jgi:hypothetical protein
MDNLNLDRFRESGLCVIIGNNSRFLTDFWRLAEAQRQRRAGEE